MLAQAEHDPETRVGLITTSRRIAEATLKEVERQLGILATANVAGVASQKRGEIVSSQMIMLPKRRFLR